MTDKTYVTKIFGNSAKTGRTNPRSLTPRQIGLALEEVDYTDFTPGRNAERMQQLQKTVLEYDIDDLDNPFVPCPKRRPRRVAYEVPTISGLVANDLKGNKSALKMMKLGFEVVAEAMQVQRSGSTEPRRAGDLLHIAGGALSSGFTILNGGNNGLETNKVTRDQATLMAQRLFKAGLRNG